MKSFILVVSGGRKCELLLSKTIVFSFQILVLRAQTAWQKVNIFDVEAVFLLSAWGVAVRKILSNFICFKSCKR